MENFKGDQLCWRPRCKAVCCPQVRPQELQGEWHPPFLEAGGAVVPESFLPSPPFWARGGTVFCLPVGGGGQQPRTCPRKSSSETLVSPTPGHRTQVRRHPLRRWAAGRPPAGPQRTAANPCGRSRGWFTPASQRQGEGQRGLAVGEGQQGVPRRDAHRHRWHHLQQPRHHAGVPAPQPWVEGGRGCSTGRGGDTTWTQKKETQKKRKINANKQKQRKTHVKSCGAPPGYELSA